MCHKSKVENTVIVELRKKKSVLEPHVVTEFTVEKVAQCRVLRFDALESPCLVRRAFRASENLLRFRRVLLELVEELRKDFLRRVKMLFVFLIFNMV